MLTMDAPEHTRYRKLVNRGFTPRQMRMLEPHIRDLTAKILDEVIEQGGCDYVVDVAAELPLQVIAEMLGVPQEDRHKLFEWSNRMIGSRRPRVHGRPKSEVMNAQVEMFMYANELAAQRRARAARRHHHRAARRRGRRRPPDRDGLQPVLLADRSGGQRDDPQLDLARHQGVLRLPRPVPAVRRGPVARAVGDRGDRALGVAGHVLPAQRDAATRSCAASSSRPATRSSIWYISANRDEDVFDRPVRVRHPPFTERARRLRRRRTAPLPRCESRAHGDLRAARGDGEADADDRAHGRCRPAALELHRRHQAHAGEVPGRFARSRPS